MNNINENVVHLERYQYIAKSEVHLQDNKRDFRDPYNTSKFSSNRFNRGWIEVKRFFNDDNFLLRIVVFEPRGHSHNGDKVFLTINKKLIEPKLIDKKTIENDQWWHDAMNNLKDPFYKYIEYSPQIASLFNYRETILNSQELNLKWNDIKSITMTFETIDSVKHIPVYWQIKRVDALPKNNYVLNTKSDNVKITTPEYYKWTFKEYSDWVVPTHKKNFEFNINIAKWNFLTKTNKIASIQGSNNEYYKTDDWPKKIVLDEVDERPEVYDEFYKNKIKNNKEFQRYQSLPNYGFFNLWTNISPSIESKLSHNQISSVYNGQKEHKEFYYDKYIEDEKNGTITNSKLEQKVGINIPYNFSGELIKSLNFKFMDLGEKSDDNFNVTINHSSYINKPILDYYNGIVKLESEEDDLVKEKELKYSINIDEIEELSKIEIQKIIYHLEKFLKSKNE